MCKFLDDYGWKLCIRPCFTGPLYVCHCKGKLQEGSLHIYHKISMICLQIPVMLGANENDGILMNQFLNDGSLFQKVDQAFDENGPQVINAKVSWFACLCSSLLVLWTRKPSLKKTRLSPDCSDFTTWAMRRVLHLARLYLSIYPSLMVRIVVGKYERLGQDVQSLILPRSNAFCGHRLVSSFRCSNLLLQIQVKLKMVSCS